MPPPSAAPTARPTRPPVAAVPVPKRAMPLPMVDVYTVPRTLHVPVVAGDAASGATRTCQAVRLTTAKPNAAGVLKVTLAGKKPYYTSPPLATLGMPAAALDAALAADRARYGSLARIDTTGVLTIDGCDRGANESAAYAVPRSRQRGGGPSGSGGGGGGGDWRRVAPLTLKDVHAYAGAPVDVGMRARTVYAMCLPPKGSARKPRLQLLYRLLERARLRPFLRPQLALRAPLKLRRLWHCCVAPYRTQQ